MVFSTFSFLIANGLNLANADRPYEPDEIKYKVLATDKTFEDLNAACHELGDYVDENIGVDWRHSVVNDCSQGEKGGAVEDKTKSAWFGPDWKKLTQEQAEQAIANNKWFACSGGESNKCFDGYEQLRFPTKDKVCDVLLDGHEADVHRARLYPRQEAMKDCQAAIATPGVLKTKKLDPAEHLRPLESFCKMDTLDEICENAWYDDDSDVWKLRTSCQCQAKHTVDCNLGESTQSCMNRMFQNLGMDATEFERIEFVMAENDNSEPHTKKISTMDELLNQMAGVIASKEEKWVKEGKLHDQADIEA